MHVPPAEAPQEDRGLTQIAFSRLLEWLDDGVESHGETYLEMRRRLVSYFDRRNRSWADELADETFNRISRTLEEEGEIATTPPARYCYVVARFVLLEDFRRERAQIQFNESRRGKPPGSRLVVQEPDDAARMRERRLDCLDCCLEKLKAEQRDLVIEYYRDARRQKIDRRRTLAGRLGITMNALGIRACRIRATLEECLEACCGRR